MNMKRTLNIMLLALLAVPVAAQETYENAKLATEDLNGTARYVGMGGAMEALGADISTISTNPAGIGLFRRSSASASVGFINQEGAKSFGGGHTTNVSFDQVGFVWTNQISSTDFVNFAFNYHKSRNFNQILSAADRLNRASQNKLTANKFAEGYLYDGDKQLLSCSLLDEIYDEVLNNLQNPGSKDWHYMEADRYALDRRHTGYIGEYDFNLSGNVDNSFYWGITLGLHDVHYTHYGEYSENLVDYEFSPAVISDDRTVTGQGADLKLGVIFRPIEESPLRFGVSVVTPTWYNLRTSNYTRYDDLNYYADGRDNYEFKLYTPWKFGLSAGHTIGQYLAMGLSYEFTDYTNLDSREAYTDDWGDDASESDKMMNLHTSKTLKGVSTVKAGVEFKPDPALAVRLGYNYVSPMYEKDGFKDGCISSVGSNVSSATDFVNWGATHRITCGLGYQSSNWNLSVAYQYAMQKGDFAPFYSETFASEPVFDNVADMVKVDNKRHQLLFTATYSF